MKKIIVSIMMIIPSVVVSQEVPEIPLRMPHEVTNHSMAVHTNIREYAQALITAEWGEESWYYFDYIIHKESGWRVGTAHYPSGYAPSGVKSSAFGLAGFLDGSWSTVGCEKTDNQVVQIHCAMTYIEQRYGTVVQAYNFHIKNNWY